MYKYYKCKTYITELLNVYYNFINSIDNMKKKNKIILSKKGFNMRIISGKARGTKLYTLDGNDTRPTLDRVKEALFNIIQNEIQDSIFLDLFSGSGAIGLEAVSRGAKKAILCENSAKAINIIEKNIDKTHLKEKIILIKNDFKRFLEKYKEENIDIVYIDPPYNTNYAYEATKIIIQKRILNPNSVIIIETDDKERIIEQLSNLKDKIEIQEIREYGRAKLIFLCQRR